MDNREKIVQEYFQSWIAKDATVLRETFAPDALYIESWGPAYRGLAAIEAWFADWTAANEVLAWDIQAFWHRDDTCVCEWFFRCKCGEIAELDGVSIIRFDGDGKIAYLKEYKSDTPNYYPYEEGR